MQDNFFDRSCFFVNSTKKPFFPSLITSLDPSVLVQIIGVPSLRDSIFTIPKASDLLADMLAKLLENIGPMLLFGILPKNETFPLSSKNAVNFSKVCFLVHLQ